MLGLDKFDDLKWNASRRRLRLGKGRLGFFRFRGRGDRFRHL